MKNMADRSLLLGAVMVGVVLAALVWFVGVSPKLSAAAQAHEATQTQRDQNDLLQLTLTAREKDAALKPTYERELFEIRDQLPNEENIPGVRRAIDEIVAKAGLEVENDHFSTPEYVLGGISLAAPMEAVGLTSNIEGLKFTTLVATEFGFEIVGSWEAVIQVILEMESGDHRYFQMNNISLSQETTEGGGTGQVRAEINGLFFTLDHGVEGITVRPPERPWPGSEKGIEQPENPRNPFTQTGV
jgi:hypothetical protein